MEMNDLLSLLSRWLHILPAIVLVGGTVFMRFAFVPLIDTMPEGATEELQSAMRSRWAKLVMISAGLLLLSGLYNAAMKAMSFKLDMTYNVLLLVKILLALGVFFLSSVLAGRSDLAKRVQQNESFWLSLNLLLAVALVCIAGFMKTSDQTPKVKSQTARSIICSTTWHDA